MHIPWRVNLHWFLGLLADFFGFSVMLKIADHTPQSSLKPLPKNDMTCGYVFIGQVFG